MAEPKISAAQAPAYKVLVADSQPVNRDIVRRILEPMGASVTETADGREALDATATVAFDLILLDMKMPGMDGATVVRRIRASDSPNCRAPILVFLAGQETYAERLLTYEFDGTLTKPLVHDHLIEAFIAYCPPGSRRPDARRSGSIWGQGGPFDRSAIG